MTIDNTKTKKLLKQTLGTTNKVLDMVNQDAYCIDIIQQIDSVIGTLKTTRSHLLSKHLDHCVEHRFKVNKDQTIKELIDIYKLNN